MVTGSAGAVHAPVTVAGLALSASAWATRQNVSTKLQGQCAATTASATAVPVAAMLGQSTSQLIFVTFQLFTNTSSL